MLYELVLIARINVRNPVAKNAAEAQKMAHKALLKTCALHILDNNGVVRQFTNLGKMALPYRMKRHQEIFDAGSYFTMQFDSSPEIMQSLSKLLALNEDVIRHTMIKAGDSIKAITTRTPPEHL